jgi:hypothetical protein
MTSWAIHDCDGIQAYKLKELQPAEFVKNAFAAYGFSLRRRVDYRK